MKNIITIKKKQNKKIMNNEIYSYLTNETDFQCFHSTICQNKSVIPDHSQYFFQNDTTCSICLEKVSHEFIFQFPCHHVFHKNCISECIQYKNQCPTCKTQFLIRKKPNHLINCEYFYPLEK